MSERVRHERAKRVFFALGDVPAAERDRALDQLCEGDARLRRDVALLLEYDARPSAPLDHPPLRDHLRLDPNAPASPARIGGYRILEKLGEGGMGVVYRALQDQPCREVALKVLRSPLPATEDIDRFRREVEVLGRLAHPGIAQVLQAGTHDVGAGALPFFAMELVRGLPLRDYLAQARPSRRQRLRLVVAMCDAVEHAHALGIVHRDLKPANVLVEADGRPRVIDFGVARVLDPTQDVDAAPTRTGMLVGTRAFMSPEQLLGRAPDARADVYALGLLLWEVLLGAPPYDLRDRGTDEVIRVVCREPLPRAPLRRAGIPRDLCAILAVALAKERIDRYPSAGALAADLRRHLEDRPVSVRGASPWLRLGKWTRRHPVRAMGLAAVASVVLAALGLGLSTAAAGVRAARDASAAWRAGDLAAVQRWLTDAPAWSTWLGDPALVALRRGESAAPTEALPAAAVLAQLRAEGAAAAGLVASRYLERDGLHAHPVLLRFLARGLDGARGPTELDRDDALRLLARLLFERPDVDAVAHVASVPVRARLDGLAYDALDHGARLQALAAWAGCGNPASLPAQLSWCERAAADAALAPAQRHEEAETNLLQRTFSATRPPATPYSKRHTSTTRTASTSPGAFATRSRARPSTTSSSTAT
ncbi:MAG: serine/threonine-protein kinase, partial [Planctomycetota bacterium]